MATKKVISHIQLTSHPGRYEPLPIQWGASTALERGPVVGTLSDPSKRNVIGTHSGSYAVYRALPVAAEALDPEHRPDFTDTTPWHAIALARHQPHRPPRLQCWQPDTQRSRP